MLNDSFSSMHRALSLIGLIYLSTSRTQSYHIGGRYKEDLIGGRNKKVR